MTVKGTASSSGSYSVKVTVPKKASQGKTSVVATGLTATRTGKATIKVT